MEHTKIVHEFDSWYSAHLFAMMVEVNKTRAGTGRTVKCHGIGTKVFAIISETPSSGPREDVPPPGALRCGDEDVHECPVCGDEVQGTFDEVGNHIYDEHCDEPDDIEEFYHAIGGPKFVYTKEEEVIGDEYAHEAAEAEWRHSRGSSWNIR